jgi:uncharacterized protein YggT (Ycf19 family)
MTNKPLEKRMIMTVKIRSEITRFLLNIVSNLLHPVTKSIPRPKSKDINMSILFFSLAIHTLL